MGRGAGRASLCRGKHLSGSIPVTVVGGYLGAGKTTLVNHVLRHAGGLRIAVLVNDFGELPIDADLIEARSDEVVSVVGGCVCCSFGSELIDALKKIPLLSPIPRHVLIETSGVALPGAVARSLTLLPAYHLDGTVVLADAETVRARAADRYLSDTVTRQLADADFVVLNKTDLVPAREVTALEQWLREQAPRARLICAQRAQVPLKVLLGVADAHPAVNVGTRVEAGTLRSIAPAPATTVFESAPFRPTAALDVGCLGKALVDPVLGVLRAKGRLLDLDGSWKTLHVVGSRYEVTRTQAAGESSALICIGLVGDLNRPAIVIQIERAGFRSLSD